MQKNKYLISETTKSERIALIKSWIPEEYELSETYADDKVEFSEYLKKL